MIKIALVGVGHGKACADIAEELGYDVWFFDDAFPRVASCGKWQAIGTSDDLISQRSNFDSAFVSIGNCGIREKVQSRLVAGTFPTKAPGIRWHTV
jgi:hypothetical protein